MHDDPSEPVETGDVGGGSGCGEPGDADGDDHGRGRRHRHRDASTSARRLRSRTMVRRSPRRAATVPVLVTDDTDTPNDKRRRPRLPGLFTSDFGADGFKDADDNNVEDADAISYALGVSAPGGDDSGLIDTLSGRRDLAVPGERTGRGPGRPRGGRGDAAGWLRSRSALTPNNGIVTLEQDRSVVHDDSSDPVETGDVGGGAGWREPGDADGDDHGRGRRHRRRRASTSATAFAIQDDGPTITAATATLPVLVTDDTDTPNAHGVGLVCLAVHVGLWGRRVQGRRRQRRRGRRRDQLCAGVSAPGGVQRSARYAVRATGSTCSWRAVR